MISPAAIRETSVCKSLTSSMVVKAVLNSSERTRLETASSASSLASCFSRTKHSQVLAELFKRMFVAKMQRSHSRFGPVLFVPDEGVWRTVGV